MARVLHTRQAREDLLAIWSYVAANSLTAADRVVDAIDSKCAALAESPKLGAARPDIAPELRYSPVGRYLIFYREVPDGVEVVRVLHGARDLHAIFDGPASRLTSLTEPRTIAARDEERGNGH